MAIPTRISDIPNLEKKIAGLKTEAGMYQDRLNSSPTALGGEGDPTSFDISNQESLQRIQGEVQALNDKRLKTKWYGDQTKDLSADAPSPPQGAIGTVLDFISRPVRGIVGATKHALGQGKGSLYQDIADNMVRDKNYFGDVLRSSGIHGGVAAPLGFALDIALDPVNWATMGTGALIPRLFSGAYKGFQAGNVARGVSIAARSRGLGMASTLGRYTPYFRKSETFGKLGEASLKAAGEWEDLRGFTAADLALQKGAGVDKYRSSLGGLINQAADAVPGGRSLLNTLWYDPKEWIRQAHIKDVLQKTLGIDVGDVGDIAKSAAKGEDITPLLREARMKAAARIKSATLGPIEETLTGKRDGIDIDFDAPPGAITMEKVDQTVATLQAKDPDLLQKLEPIVAKVTNGYDDVYGVMKDGKPYITEDAVENASRIIQDVQKQVGDPSITWDMIDRMYKADLFDETGIRWYDNARNSVKKWEKAVSLGGKEIKIKGEYILDKYDQAMGIFRSAVIGASVSAHTFAVVGNLAMRQMATGSISLSFMKNLALSFRVYHNSPGAALELKLLLKKAGQSEDEIASFMKEYSTPSHATFGSLDFAQSEENIERILAVARGKGAKIPDEAAVKADIAKVMAQIKEEFPDIFQSANRYTKTEAGTTRAFEALKEGGEDLSRDAVVSGMLSADNPQASLKLSAAIKERAKTGGVGWKAMDAWMNWMPSQYEKHDQIFKMANFVDAVSSGFTEYELRGIRHLVDIDPTDLALRKKTETVVLKSGKEASTGRVLYRLSPKSALELSNVMFLNYNAMPAAIRVLRNFPLVGSPFISFMYGMALKTGQTLAYNPSAFNKMAFAMSEFGGVKTPLEKKALGQERYSFLNQQGMYRIPFISEDAPLYVNMRNAIPYFNLGMFGPTQTDYGKSPRAILAGAIQKSPFLDDPAGNAIFENLILPMILGDAIRPQGMFGQPLYPVDATGIERLGYGARSFAEAFVPTVVSYAGLVTPESMAEYLPKYRWKQLSRAKAGLNPLGISSPESKTSRTLRGVFQTSGFPIQAPLETKFQKK